MWSNALVGEITVVVPHYGDSRATLDLVERLRRQTGITLQIVVADDHSPVPFPDAEGIEVVRRERNGGFGTNVNSGVQLAAYDLMLILNSDVDIEDSFVADLVEAATPWMPAVVSPRVVNADGRDEWVGARLSQDASPGRGVAAPAGPVPPEAPWRCRARRAGLWQDFER